MAIRNYYIVLGIPRDATPRRIRDAYLKLAKERHPDRVGESGKQGFQDIQEAYETLSDPERRRRYNHHLDESVNREILRQPGEPEVLVSEPLTVLGQPESVRPSFDALYERLLRNFTGIGVPKGERVEGLNIEIVLNPEEAARGVVVPIEVPTFHRCPFCDGTGYEWVFPCSYCLEQGMVERGETVRVRVPPNVETGTIYEIPLTGLGIHNFCIRLHLFVG
jgi:DnaJ-class molecular chaperone